MKAEQSRAEQNNFESCFENVKRIKNIPACLNKCKDGKFLGAKDFDVCNVNAEYASCITSRYYKGISAHHDNMVIVQIENE